MKDWRQALKKLTFTFDNGPIPGQTGRLLDFLFERGIKSTFFVVGKLLDDARGRELMIRAQSEGHWIGNHTQNHGPPLGAEGGADRAAYEIGEAERRIGGFAHPRKFFRPNGAGALGPHLLSAGAVDYLKANAYTVVTWNNVPGDWIEPRDAWFERAIKTVDETDWSLLVLHDVHIGEMLDSLGRFCDEMERRGVTFEQDFPPSCVILDRGEPGARLPDYVAPGEIRRHLEPTPEPQGATDE